MVRRANGKGRDQRKGIQSIEIGSALLKALAESNSALGLRDLSAAAGMPASKAHRYLVSMIRCGLVQQNPTTGQYDLGEVSLRVGLTALNRLDVVRFGTEAAVELNQRTGSTVILTVWGTAGPTVVAMYNSVELLITNLNVGGVLPLTRSASGQIFLAYLPRVAVKARTDAELKGAYAQAANSRVKNWKDVEALIAQVREDGLGATYGDMVPDQSALAAPIFDHQGKLAASLAIIGVSSVIEPRSAQSPAALLREFADGVSHRMGYWHGKNNTLEEWREAKEAGKASASMPPALKPPRGLVISDN